VAIGPSLRIADRSRETAERYLEALRELAGVGVNWATVQLPHPSRAAFLENVDWFGREVVAGLHL